MQFITRTNRHLICFGTLDGQVAAASTVRLVDAFVDKHEVQKLGFTITVRPEGRVRISKIGGKQLRHILYMAALNAKKTNAARKALYNRPWKKGPLLPFATVARARICRGKVRCAVPRRLFQKTGLKVWGFRQFVLCAELVLVVFRNFQVRKFEKI